MQYFIKNKGYYFIEKFGSQCHLEQFIELSIDIGMKLFEEIFEKDDKGFLMGEKRFLFTSLQFYFLYH